ncbi:hypothetical protein EN12_23890 [Vibrio cholerae]|uniref:Uncharacterized protein n=1 Tax=Vibrio cholerae TaxID=666 RepID=A0A5B1BYP4_VIBCL|nr:hypothetical protein [Vibrio cholerae]AKO78140.1 hypothetical protein EN12_23890 [Vibrio cholerae]KAA1253101.1 hypothetical protein F0M16_19365 [Vibrio cholerae]HDV5593578.1 hypothetical protein [Vibrio cholerae]
MKYHQPTKGFIISPESIEQVADALMHSLKCVRLAGGKPLTPYEVLGMDDIDHAQAGIVEAATALNIDLGHKRYNKIDLSKV